MIPKPTHFRRIARTIQGIIVVTLVSILCAGVATVYADTDEQTEEQVEEQSYYSNPAQVSHAAQLSQSAINNNEQVKQSYSDYQDAKNSYDALGSAATEEDYNKLQAAETNYQNTLAEQTGLTETEIANMRNAGMGWGEIANELGIHPGTLGLGHSKGKKSAQSEFSEFDTTTVSDEELAQAASRKTGRGVNNGHGLGLRDATHSPGTARTASNTNSKKGAKGQGAIGGGTGLGSSNSAGSQGRSGSAQNSGSGNSRSDKGSNASGSSNAGGNNKGKGNSGGNSGKGQGKGNSKT